MTTTQLPLRHRIAGGVLGLGLAATLGISATLAQDNEATPEAEQSPATEEEAAEDAPASPDFDVAPESETRMAERIQAIGEIIDAVQADREAAGEIDATIVDQLLEQATGLLDGASQSLNGGAAEDVPQQLTAAHSAAMAAEALVRAQLNDYGLPSQQAGASRTLDTTYRHVKASTELTQDSTDETVAYFVTTAQELYRQAYELYNAGTYAQAADTARVAAALGHVAEILGTDKAAEAAQVEEGVAEAGGRGDAEIHVLPTDPGAGVWSIERGDRGPRGDVIGPDGRGAHVAQFIEAGVLVEAAPGDDFSTDSPIDVPAPEF